MDPAAEVHLVHRDRPVEGIASIALLHPGAVPPVVAAELGHHRGVIGAHLVAESVGVGLLVAVTILGPHFVFISGALVQPRDEQLPAAAQPLLHRMVATIPAVEITEHRHTAGVGSPEAELHPGHPVVADGMGAHPLPDVVVVAFGEQMAVELAHPFVVEGPGVVGFMLDAAPKHPHPVAAAWIVIEIRLEDPVVVGVGHRPGGLSLQQQLHPLGVGHPHPNHPAPFRKLLGAQNREGMVVATFGQPGGVVDHPIEAGQHHGAQGGCAGSLRCFGPLSAT